MEQSPHEPAGAHRSHRTEILLHRLEGAEGEDRRAVEDELIHLNLGVAREVARRYHGRGIPADDLDQVASIGLVKAVRGYDPARASDFLAYAVPTIRGEVRRHFRDHGWAVRPPRSVQELQPRVTRARGELWQRCGREPHPREIAGELGVDEAPVREAMRAEGCFHPTSLDTTYDDAPTLAERLAGTEPGYAQADARVALRPLLRGLSERERRILTMRFYEGRTQAEIGREIGVTQMQVSRLLSGLFERMRAELADAAA